MRCGIINIHARKSSAGESQPPSCSRRHSRSSSLMPGRAPPALLAGALVLASPLAALARPPPASAGQPGGNAACCGSDLLWYCRCGGCNSGNGAAATAFRCRLEEFADGIGASAGTASEAGCAPSTPPSLPLAAAQHCCQLGSLGLCSDSVIGVGSAVAPLLPGCGELPSHARLLPLPLPSVNSCVRPGRPTNGSWQGCWDLPGAAVASNCRQGNEQGRQARH